LKGSSGLWKRKGLKAPDGTGLVAPRGL